MGYLDKSKQTVTAHFTKRGRELLADALSGNTSGDYIITKFALGDDEVDYALYDETQPTNLRGRVIENMPLVESTVHDSEAMNYFITHPPPVALQAQLANIPNDNLVEMYDVNNPPLANFTYGIDSQGSPPAGTPPTANFNYVQE